jgi:hypothetical protein
LGSLKLDGVQGIVFIVNEFIGQTNHIELAFEVAIYAIHNELSKFPELLEDGVSLKVKGLPWLTDFDIQKRNK